MASTKPVIRNSAYKVRASAANPSGNNPSLVASISCSPFTRLQLLERWLLITAVLVFLGTVIQNAWVCDDAYITFRTVDNAVQGYGLRWNPAERVQSYTHPLWMFLHIPLAFASISMFYGTIALSTALSFAAMLVLSFWIAKSPWAGILATAILVSSKSFIIYSTSGLENPLTHLLLVLFLATLLLKDINLLQFRLIAMLAGLAAFNRLDLVLFFLPALCYILFILRSRQAVAALLVGFAPVICWEGFSIVYYGFPFPNTYYAKLCAGIPPMDLATQGLRYLVDCLMRDPMTIIAVAASFTAAAITRNKRFLLISGGTLLYLLYIIHNGGCFMAGRFLTAPMLCSVAVICSMSWANSKRVAPLVAGVVIAAGLLTPHPPFFTLPGPDPHEQDAINEHTGIADEHAYYFEGNGLINASRHADMPSFFTAEDGRRLHDSAPQTVTANNVGVLGYRAGPGVHIVDTMALNDPLLARLPAINTKINWRIGHFERCVPAGYMKTLETGVNQLSDPGLARYYDQLRLIIRGDIFSMARLIAIWKLNIGRYNDLLKAYIDAPIPHIPISAMITPIIANNRMAVWRIPHSGVQVDLLRLSHGPEINIITRGINHYLLLFGQGDRWIAQDEIQLSSSTQGKPHRCHIDVAPDVANIGYDRFAIYPFVADGHPVLLHVDLNSTSP